MSEQVQVQRPIKGPQPAKPPDWLEPKIPVKDQLVAGMQQLPEMHYLQAQAMTPDFRVAMVLQPSSESHPAQISLGKVTTILKNERVKIGYNTGEGFQSLFDVYVQEDNTCIVTPTLIAYANIDSAPQQILTAFTIIQVLAARSNLEMRVEEQPLLPTGPKMEDLLSLGGTRVWKTRTEADLNPYALSKELMSGFDALVQGQ